MKLPLRLWMVVLCSIAVLVRLPSIQSAFCRLFLVADLAVRKGVNDSHPIPASDARNRFWLRYLQASQGRELRNCSEEERNDLAYLLVLHGRNEYLSDPENALVCFLKTTKLQPTYSAAYFYAGQTRQKQRRFKEAICFYRRAISRGTFDPRLDRPRVLASHMAGHASRERSRERIVECLSETE